MVPRIMRQPEVFIDPQNAPKSLAVGGSPQTPLGELTALPRPPEGLPRLEITSGYALDRLDGTVANALKNCIYVYTL